MHAQMRACGAIVLRLRLSVSAQQLLIPCSCPVTYFDKVQIQMKASLLETEQSLGLRVDLEL